MSTAPRLEAAKLRDWGNDETGCTVLHIDMDAFYASLEIARNPALKGRPVIIGTGTRSVVSAASYEARAFGVNSAMPTAKARQLCPGGVFLPVDMVYYRAVSRRIFSEVLGAVTDRVERVSVDEGYMDVSAALLRWGRPSRIGSWIRKQVAERFHITCSVGIAHNKLVAKMASTNAKPDGMLLIPAAEHAEFVQMMPLRGVPGIGPALERRLNEWGITSVADLAQLDEANLERATRSRAAAHTLFLESHGIDEREVHPYTPEKSIGSESTFPADTTERVKVLRLLRHCCDEVASTLRSRSLVARTVTVKLRFANLSYATRSRTLEHPVDTAATMYPQVVLLLDAMLGIEETGNRATGSGKLAAGGTPGDTSSSTPQRALPRLIRLAGVSASGLEAADQVISQPSLEDVLEEGDSPTGSTRSERQRLAEHTLDRIRSRYGRNAAGLGL